MNHGTRYRMPASSGQWKEVASTNKPLKRHEHAYAKVHEMFYLIGGRRVQPVQAYDPATKTWKNLGKPPIERHHFQAVTVDEKEQWFTLASPQGDLPDPRAGTASLTLGEEVLIIGGESAQKLAHSSVDALDVKTGVWRSLPPLLQGRHASQPVLHDGRIYLPAGSITRGGTETDSQEVFELAK